MDLRTFLPALARYAGIADQDLLEKDVRLHFLLEGLVQDPSVGEDLVFKGGTCLIKCYLDYPRFGAVLLAALAVRHGVTSWSATRRFVASGRVPLRP